MKYKNLIIIGMFILMITGVAVASILIPKDIEIEKVVDDGFCALVYVKGYAPDYLPCVPYDTFETEEEFKAQLKLIIAGIDDAINSPVQPIDDNTDKFNSIKDLSGSIGK